MRSGPSRSRRTRQRRPPASCGPSPGLTSVAERSLREGEQLKLDSVLDGVADGVVVCTAATATPNAAARALLAIPLGVEFRTALFNPRDLDGKPYEHPEGHIPGEQTIATGAGGRFRIRATALDGRELVLDGSISPAPGGAVIVFRDVTAEHEREVLNERYLYALFNSIPIPLTVADASTRALISANQAFLDLIGYELDAIVGLTPPFPWWEPDEQPLSAFEPGSRHPSGLPAQGRPAAARRGGPARGPR